MKNRIQYRKTRKYSTAKALYYSVGFIIIGDIKTRKFEPCFSLIKVAPVEPVSVNIL